MQNVGRKRARLGAQGDAIVLAGARRGRSAEQIQADLAAAGVPVSARTAARRKAEAMGVANAARAAAARRASPPARAPSPRTMVDVLSGLTAGDRALVLAEIDDAADEALDARNREIAELIDGLGREQDACPVCPTCGLQGTTSKLVQR